MESSPVAWDNQRQAQWMHAGQKIISADLRNL
jgi:hypothetical protein